MKEIAWKDDMRSFQVEYMPVNNLIIKINEMLDKICNEFPEVDRNAINVLGESDTICMGDYDQDITVLSFRFKRHMTEQEIDMLRWGKENERKRQIQLLQKLIKDNSDDVIKFLESIGYEIRHKDNPMKIDYSDSIINMFCDEFDKFTELSKTRHEYMKENEK
jgi:hypothetical protein